MKLAAFVSVMTGIGAWLVAIWASIKLVWAVLVVAVAPIAVLVGAADEGTVQHHMGVALAWAAAAVALAITSLVTGAIAGVGFMARRRRGGGHAEGPPPELGDDGRWDEHEDEYEYESEQYGT